MATSSIYADFSIRDNKKADAFADACEWSALHRPPKRRHKAVIVKDKAQLDNLFEKLNRKYGCDSK